MDGSLVLVVSSVLVVVVALWVLFTVQPRLPR